MVTALLRSTISMLAIGRREEIGKGRVGKTLICLTKASVYHCCHLPRNYCLTAGKVPLNSDCNRGSNPRCGCRKIRQIQMQQNKNHIHIMDKCLWAIKTSEIIVQLRHK